jgi:hypothetical protein
VVPKRVWDSPVGFADLVEMAERFRTDFPSVRPTPEAVQYGMAATLLHAYVGSEWCDRQIAGRAESYLTARSADGAERMKVQLRFAQLGEMVFNLQRVPGGLERVARIVNASLEVAVSDLDAARLLRLSGHEIRFVPESGVKGADYDIELPNRTGSEMCCESKCKVETTALSEASIFNSLHDGAAQLPPDRPGVIFVKLPEPWLSSPEIATAAPAALRRFFAGSGRTLAVIFHWEEWWTMDSGGVMRITRFREETSDRSRFFGSLREPLLQNLGPVHDHPTWIRFTDAIRRASPSAR